jgi:hypothetical protein
MIKKVIVGVFFKFCRSAPVYPHLKRQFFATRFSAEENPKLFEDEIVWRLGVGSKCEAWRLLAPRRRFRLGIWLFLDKGRCQHFD